MLTACLNIPMLAMQIDVSEEEDQFQAVTTACLNVLILAVETRLDVALQQMTRMPWATLETVSHATIRAIVPILLPAACLLFLHAPCLALAGEYARFSWPCMGECLSFNCIGVATCMIARAETVYWH